MSDKEFLFLNTTLNIETPTRTKLRELLFDDVCRMKQLYNHTGLLRYNILYEVSNTVLKNRGNQSLSALKLGISRGTLRKYLTRTIEIVDKQLENN